MTDNSMRLDKWLWAARFFKTRSLAQKHIELGRVEVNHSHVKSSKNIQVGDVIDMRLNHLPYRLTVLVLSSRRQGAPQARLLYQEDEAVVALRESEKSLQKAMQISSHFTEGRPTKRNRRQMDSFWSQNG